MSHLTHAAGLRGSAQYHMLVGCFCIFAQIGSKITFFINSSRAMLSQNIDNYFLLSVTSQRTLQLFLDNANKMQSEFNLEFLLSFSNSRKLVFEI
jgi:hypothetical protein